MTTFYEVKNIFLEKYENGDMWKNGSRVEVIFSEGEKVYSYSYTNFANLLNKVLDTNEFILQSDADNMKKQIEYNQELLDNGYRPAWGKNNSQIGLTDKEIKSLKNEIKQLRKSLEISYIL